MAANQMTPNLTRYILVLSAVLLAGSDAFAKFPEAGKAAPGFSLVDLSGALISLSDLAYTGAGRAHSPKKTLILDFFRTDCAPCRKSLPKLLRLHQEFKSKGLKILLIALLEEENGEEKLNAFLKKNPVPYQVLVDSYGVVARKYIRTDKGYELPMSFVVDREGVLRLRLGFIDAKALSQLRTTLESVSK
jgi:peroxiredoxin